MPLRRSVAACLGVLALGVLAASSGCGADDQAAAGREGVSVTLAPNTCWTAATLGEDPQAVLALSRTFGVDYFAAAYAVDGRPAFARTEACAKPHHVEVYQVVPVDAVTPVVSDYAAFLRSGTPAFEKLGRAVRRACMGTPLATVARISKVPGVLVEPAFPEGVVLGWAPPSPEQWAKGQRVYACTLSSATPVSYRYAAVFTRAFPTSDRTCISNRPLRFVDCARTHDRERIAVLDVRQAVAAGKLPGRNALTAGPSGRFVQLSAPVLASLDRACTTYLRAMSSTRKHTGVAVPDAERWPGPEGNYRIDCEADAPPARPSVPTQGSVFDRS